MNRNYVARPNCNPAAGTGLISNMRAQECRDRTTKDDGKPSTRRPLRSRVVVSVSTDIEFDRHLRMEAMERGLIAIRVDSLEAASRIIRGDCCGMVLLDLDAVGREGWEKAGDLMQEDKCPPMLLLTGIGEQFDLRMTIFAGSIFEKSTETTAMLNVVEEILHGSTTGFPQEDSGSGGPQLKELFRAESTVSQVPVRRYWGLNE